ncbi:MAG: FIST C-terminal domain-containing protein [Coriobacteriales bacterium]|nr:FIST C-terminal domain-containing protein [Coriobacteriales bacterium]
MKRVFTAFTLEIDDVNAAVDELLAQIDIDELLPHSIGLVSYTMEFSSSEILPALQEALPFDLIGMTTLGTATDGSYDLNQLSILVLSSDEMSFSTALSEPINSDDESLMTNTYQQAVEALPAQPALMIAFAPLLLEIVGGDFYVDGLARAGCGVPLFGSVAIDPEISQKGSRVYYRGQEYDDRLALLVFAGNVSPHFNLVTASRIKMADEEGVVTNSHNNLLISVDNQPAIEFIKKDGVCVNEDGSVDGILLYPLFVDYNDNTIPVTRSMAAVTPEGHIVAGGKIEAGSHVSVGFLDGHDVVSSARAHIAELELGPDDTLLLFSCINRYFTLGYDYQEEAEAIHQRLEATGTKFMLAYAAGEFCPVPNKDDDGTLTNRLHNNTLIGLVI